MMLSIEQEELESIQPSYAYFLPVDQALKYDFGVINHPGLPEISGTEERMSKGEGTYVNDLWENDAYSRKIN